MWLIILQKHKTKVKGKGKIMIQQVMTEPGKIIFREIQIPEINENQVLFKL